jgi:hypothetical protein
MLQHVPRQSVFPQMSQAKKRASHADFLPKHRKSRAHTREGVTLTLADILSSRLQIAL